MRTSSDRQVDITENGRAGTVTYRDGAGTLSFYWEFGGGDVVAIIQVNDAAAWSAGRSWTAGERAGILRFVADEVIHRKAPGCRAEIDDGKGGILLRQVGTPPPLRGAPDVTFVRRLSSLKAMLGIVVLVVALLFGGVM